MIKVIIIYGSTTGNTEALSKFVEKGLRFSNNNIDVLAKSAEEVHPDALKDCEGIILGCSTWGNGELQNDFVAFEERMRKIRLDGKKAAVFGPGDSSYPQFCKAVDVLEDRLKECGAEIIAEPLKIDGDIESKLEEAKEWGKNLGQKLK